MDNQTATNEQLAQAQYAPPFFDDTEFGANSIEPLLEYERMQDPGNRRAQDVFWDSLS